MDKKIRLKQQSRSILDELSRAAPRGETEQIIENRGHHIISSAINFLEMLSENLSPEEADTLSRRFFASIRNNDPKRFLRQIRKIKESRENS